MTRRTLSLIGFLLIMLVPFGCAPRPRSPTLMDWAAQAAGKSLTVDVMSWPSEVEVDCYLAEVDAAPEVQPWPEGETDVFRRTFVAKREHDDLLNFTRDLAHEVETLRNCIKQLTERTQK